MDILSTKFTRSKIKAFTLAEVLIVLGIIGVVATMTIPSLMNNMQNLAYISGFKKAYSEASQAWLTAYAHNELSVRSNWCDTTPNNNNFQAMQTYFKVVKVCNGGDNSCFATGGDTFWGTPDNAAMFSFVDNAGMSWGGAGGLCGSIIVDTNGPKRPNQFGRDRMAIAMSSDDANHMVISPQGDVVGADGNSCPHGNCLYSTMLNQ